VKSVGELRKEAYLLNMTNLEMLSQIFLEKNARVASHQNSRHQLLQAATTIRLVEQQV